MYEFHSIVPYYFLLVENVTEIWILFTSLRKILMMKTKVSIKYHLNGYLFNLQHLQAHLKILEEQIRDVCFADDAVLAAYTQRAWLFPASQSLIGFELEVNLKKTGSPAACTLERELLFLHHYWHD